MSNREEIFDQTLRSSFPKLIEKIKNENLIILMPLRKAITEQMLTLSFYGNHIYKISPYDENLFINLNGKVLKLNYPSFLPYLGWTKKDMKINIKEQYKSGEGISYYQIDNVCDEESYGTTTSSSSKNEKEESELKKFNTMSEYIEFYNNTYEHFNENYSKAKEDVNNFYYTMKNQYVIVKGFEEYYSKNFSEQALVVYEGIKKAFSNSQAEEIIFIELTESLIFDKLYDYIFDYLLRNYKNDENIIKTKLKENPNKFDLSTFEIDKAFRKCVFQGPIQMLSNLKDKTTVFEKKNEIFRIHQLIAEEARRTYENETKKTFSPTGDLLISLWTYCVAHSNANDLIAEAKFIELFSLPVNDFSEANYIATNFRVGVNKLIEEFLIKDKWFCHKKLNLVLLKLINNSLFSNIAYLYSSNF